MKRNTFWICFENLTWWRHATSRDVISTFVTKKGADVSKKYPVWVNQSSFFYKDITRAFIWGVNHLSTITGSLFIAIAVEVPWGPVRARFCWFCWQKCWRQQKYWRHGDEKCCKQKFICYFIIEVSFILRAHVYQVLDRGGGDQTPSEIGLKSLLDRTDSYDLAKDHSY